MGIEKFETLMPRIKGKKILFIATKNADYLRITQEKELFEKYAESVDCIVSAKKGYFSRIFEVGWKVLCQSVKKYDIVFVGFQAQFIIPLFYWKFHKKELWSDFFISLYDTLVHDRKKVADKSPVSWLAKKVDKYTVDKSNVIICDTVAHGSYFCDEFGIPESKIHVLYLKADTSIYFPKSAEKPDEFKDKFVVLYFGSILPLQGVDIVLGAIERLKDEKNIHFLVIGPIGNKMQKVNTDNVTYIDWLSQRELAQYIAFSDLCLAGHFNAGIEKADRTVPGKAYIYKAMGKKMILGNTKANKELYQENDENIYVMRGDTIQLAERIVQVYKNN